MKILKMAGLVCATMALSACLPAASEYPLGTTVAMAVDKKLVGSWQGTPAGGEDVYFHFLRTDNEKYLTLIMAHSDAETKKNEQMTTTISTTELGGHHYINAAMVEGEGDQIIEAPDMPKIKNANYIPVLYVWDDEDTLTLYLISADLVKEAIKSNAIAGTVTHVDRIWDDIVLTADGAKLDAFMATPQGAALFAEKYAVLKRIR